MTRRTTDVGIAVASGVIGSFITIGIAIGALWTWASRQLDRKTGGTK